MKPSTDTELSKHLSSPALQILRWRLDQNSADPSAIESAKVLLVAREKVSAAGVDSGQQYWDVLVRELDTLGKFRYPCAGHFRDVGCQSIQPGDAARAMNH